MAICLNWKKLLVEYEYFPYTHNDITDAPIPILVLTEDKSHLDMQYLPPTTATITAPVADGENRTQVLSEHQKCAER